MEKICGRRRDLRGKLCVLEGDIRGGNICAGRGDLGENKDLSWEIGVQQTGGDLYSV